MQNLTPIPLLKILSFCMRIRDLVEWHQNTFKKIDETREIDEGFFFGVKGGGGVLWVFFSLAGSF